ncbi:MAG: hypothetical protein QMC21_02110 [Flavobacteriales bacterium]|jgi:hypothetical protein|tara:strand:- start:1106 stop:1336 length:231 start_codon:yes stop_codon:yes gene_type:complete
MSHITLKIDVTNSQQVIAQEKGKLVGFASRLLSDEKRKQKVEEEVYALIKEELKQLLPGKLAENGITADVTIGIEE